MRTSEKTNKAMVTPLKGGIGKTITEIKAQDNLKYWEIHLEDGTHLGFDDCGSDKQIYAYHLLSNGKPTQTWQNVTSAATSRENEKPTAVGEQTGGELAAAPCSASQCKTSEAIQRKYEDVMSDPNVGTVLISDSTIKVEATVPKTLFEILTSPTDRLS